MRAVGKCLSATLAGAAALSLWSASMHAADPFEGTWKVSDTAGKPFEITLSADGAAKANRSGEGMTGTWKADGSAATIIWDTGWTTKIAKSGDKYVKSAFKNGEAADAKPANTSDAEKVK